jgi:gliding motility-associated-like protein
MKIRKNKFFVLTILFLSTFVYSANFPFPQARNYPYGIKPNNVSQDTMNNVVLSAYNSWRNNYLTQDGCPQPGMWRVKRPSDSNDTVSEGIGYGMLITVLMTDANDSTKQYFDGLFRYYKNYLDSNGLMHWRIDANGNIIGYNAATDADEDVALALLFAHKQWGSNGAINYLQEAQNIINALYNKCVESGTYVLKPGDVWGGSSVTNPSYFAPGFYRIFANATGNNGWLSVANKCYDITNYFYNSYNTGLVPDWCQANGQQASGYSYDYKYDACRFPWRYGLDYLWYGTTAAYNHLKKLSNWIYSQTGGTPSNIKDGYQLNGNVIGQWNNAAFVGPFTVGAMVDSSLQTWLNSLYSRLASFSSDNYYNDSLRVLTLLAVTGNFPNLWELSTGSISVYIVSPSSGSVVEGSTNVVVNATSSDGVNRVEFYVDNVLKNTDTTSPYSWIFNTTEVSDGGHTIKVVGYSNSGSSATATTWVIVNNLKEAPTIYVSGLTEGTTYQGTVTINVTGEDDIGITKVEFWLGSVLQQTKTSTPYQFSWNTTQFSDGEYIVKIRAYDTDNLYTEKQYKVYVDNVDSLPSVSITSLQNGTTVSSTITIDVTSSDDRGISKIELYLDNQIITTIYSSSGSYNLDTMSYPDGEHKLKATAYDTQNQTSSIQITLYFDNIDDPPTINSVSVYNNQIVSGTVVVSVNCSDDKGISKVQLQIESTNYEDTSSPYQFTINTKDFSDGEHVLTIIVFDTIGQTTSTTRTLIFDNTPPQVSISTPVNNQIINKTQNVNFYCEDNIKLSYCEIYLNETRISTSTLNVSSASVNYTLNTYSVSDGTYTLRVRVYDKVLNNSYAQIKIFIDNTPPVINSVSLYNEQIVSGTINVSVSATDNFGIKELKVYIDNNLYQQTNLTSFDINTTNFSDGEHSLKIEVYDNISNFTSTQTVVVFNNSNDQPPSCYLNFSSTNGVVSGNVKVYIYAEDDKQLKSLQLFVNNILISTASLTGKLFSSTYTINTTQYQDGDYSILLKVKDSLGQLSTFYTFVKIDNTGPTISTNINENEVLSNTKIITITASDINDISYLEFSILTSGFYELYKSTSDVANLEINFNTKLYENGDYILRIIAKDKLGNTSQVLRNFKIQNVDLAPNLEINFESGKRVSGEIKIPVVASDDIGISKIEFYIDNKLYSTKNFVNNSNVSIEFDLNTLLFSEGEHTLQVFVYDTKNQTAYKLITFVVDNIPEKFLLTLDNNNINEVIDFGEYVKKIEIFDKKGKLLYSAENSKWDGKINGEPLSAGVYIYCVEKSDDRKSYGVIYILK